MLQFIYIFHIKITRFHPTSNSVHLLLQTSTSTVRVLYNTCTLSHLTHTGTAVVCFTSHLDISHLYIVSPYSERNCCMFHITPTSPRHHHTCTLSHLTSAGTGNYMFHITPTHQYTCILSHLTSTGTGNYIFHIKQSSHLTPVRCPHSWPSSVAAGLH